MPRSTAEWIARSDDAKIPDRVLLRVFLRADGRCKCGCNRKILSGESWQADHVVALINGGAHAESNLQPLLTEHHKTKTRADLAAKANTYAKRKANYGIKTTKHSWGYGRNDKFKKRIDGRVVER